MCLLRSCRNGLAHRMRAPWQNWDVSEVGPVGKTRAEIEPTRERAAMAEDRLDVTEDAMWTINPANGTPVSCRITFSGPAVAPDSCRTRGWSRVVWLGFLRLLSVRSGLLAIPGTIVTAPNSNTAAPSKHPA